MTQKRHAITRNASILWAFDINAISRASPIAPNASGVEMQRVIKPVRVTLLARRFILTKYLLLMRFHAFALGLC